LKQQQHENSNLETAQKQVAEDLATKAKANVTILEKREISELGKIFV